jgi:hypothetical protein
MHLAILNSVLIIEIKDYNESSSIALHIARSGKYRSKHKGEMSPCVSIGVNPA